MRAGIIDYRSGFLRVLICVILSLPAAAVRIDGAIGDRSSIAIKMGDSSPCPENHCIYLPLVKGPLVPEVDAPPGRWPYSGQPFSIFYRYLGELNDTSHEWRIAFVQGVSSWNSTDTPITFYLYSQSGNTIGMVDDPFDDLGRTSFFIVGDEIWWAEVYGNYYWDNFYGWTDNQRRSIATHEIGHLHGIGHIPRIIYPIPSLMWDARTNEEREIYYVPRFTDIILVNQVYP